MHRVVRVAVATLVSIAVIAGLAPAAGAFKPYTHAKTGDAVLIDVADGDVTIGDHEYPVNAAVVAALTNHADFYRAGVIGPDGFPDLTYGQSVIHPEDTGLWLRHIFDSAWDAQDDTTYTETERSQILAFGYGYLMHAAGDTWAHTLVNSFAEGTFPGVGEILTDVDMAAIALRHIIVEGYIGDATEGFDGNPERGPAPGGDVSDDSSDAVEFPTAAEFGGVKRFIFETLIDVTADTPSTSRGPLIGFFQTLRAGLAAQVDDWDPKPLDELTNAWKSAKSRYDNIGKEVKDVTDLVAEFNACAVLDPTCSKTIIFGKIVIEVVDLGFTVTLDTIGAIGDLIAGAITAAEQALELAVDTLIDAYLVAWIDDIDAGLRDWAELGRAITVTMFDPQARRDLQNEECASKGAEDTQLRASCEDGIGILDVLFDQVDPFINGHLLSMLGLPDAVGDLRAALQSLSDAVGEVLDTLGLPLNPVKEVLADIKEAAKEMILELVEETFGVDIESLKSFMTDPTSWLDVGPITIDIPVLGSVTIVELFKADDHEKLDGYLGFEGSSHLVTTPPPYDGFPYTPYRLADDAEFTDLAAFDNAITLGKMLLLDGAGMDQLLSDLMGRPYALYGSKTNANVMLDPLPGVAGASPDMWLSSIDADHAWRADAQPVFPAEHPNGGQGNFPLWESCILRDDAFRTLFRDWENGDEQFPELGDTPTVDPNDPNAPVSSVVVGGTSYTSGATTYLGGAGTLTVDASDDFWHTDEIAVRVKVTDKNGASTTETMVDGDVLDLSALPDGPVTVETRASDPCRTETAHSASFVIDTTAPVVTITSPVSENLVFDTDDLSSIGWTVTDGTDGSGVASQSVTFDGAAATNGQVLDMFFLAPGTHGFVVTATDNLGNSGTTPRTFRVQATAASLISNVDRAFTLGLITKADVRAGLKDKVTNANKQHQSGKHATEANNLAAFIEQLLAQRGKAVNAATADRFIAYARDLIARGA